MRRYKGMYPYIPNTQDDEKRMLEYIGFNKIEDLFSDIPENVKLKRELNLKPSMSELEVSRKLIELSKENISTSQMTCFLGAGAYDHYIPSIVGHITDRKSTRLNSSHVR